MNKFMDGKISWLHLVTVPVLVLVFVFIFLGIQIGYYAAVGSFILLIVVKLLRS